MHGSTPTSDDNVISIGAMLRRIVLRLIDVEADPAERKARILIAYEHGHLTAEEVEDWIVLGGMVHA